MDFTWNAISWIHSCSLFPVGSDVQRGSFMSSHAKMVGSSLYITLVYVFTLVSMFLTWFLK